MNTLELERVRIRQLIQNIRLYGRSHCRMNEFTIAWVRYSELKKIEQKKKLIVSLV